jgi:Tol biopolymer transport system component
VGDGDSAHEPESWSPDGTTLSFDLYGAGVQGVWTVSGGVDGTPRAFVDMPTAVEKHSAYSPDGRWLAYTSTSLGSQQGIGVFVQPVPATGALYQVSTGQGRTPVWSRDGRELFYHETVSNQLMVASVRHAPGIEFGTPAALPIKGTIHPFPQRNFDITPDGRQLLVVLPADVGDDGARTARISVVQHWFEELRRLAPIP